MVLVLLGETVFWSWAGVTSMMSRSTLLRAACSVNLPCLAALRQSGRSLGTKVVHYRVEDTEFKVVGSQGLRILGRELGVLASYFRFGCPALVGP